MTTSLIIAIVLAVGGFLAVGLPGALLMYTAYPVVRLIFGSYSFEVAMERLGDTAWPLAIGITLVWPFTIPLAYSITRRFFSGLSPYHPPQLFLFLAIVLFGTTLLSTLFLFGTGKVTGINDSEKLITAAHLGNLQMINKLLKQGVDVNTITSSGKTALTEVLYDGTRKGSYKGDDRMMVVKALLDKGANPNLNGQDCISALGLAVSKGNNDLINALLSHGAKAEYRCSEKDYSVIFNLNFNGDASEIDILAKAGANFKAKNNWGETPLIAALQTLNSDAEKYVRYAEKLLALGVDINAQGRNGKTVLHSARAHTDHEKIIPFLLKNGANPNLKNDLGKTYQESL